MKKSIWLMIGATCSLFVLSITILVNRPTPQNEMTAVLNRVETVLEDDWKKQTVTKVSSLVYTDDEGNTIVYHVCTTTYCEADFAEQTGLNTDAISAVVSPDEAESYWECTVSGLPAVIYQKEAKAYLCWTIMPELSCVIEYDPAVQSQEDMLRMAESVPANTTTTDNP